MRRRKVRGQRTIRKYVSDTLTNIIFRRLSTLVVVVVYATRDTIFVFFFSPNAEYQYRPLRVTRLFIFIEWLFFCSNLHDGARWDARATTTGEWTSRDVTAWKPRVTIEAIAKERSPAPCNHPCSRLRFRLDAFSSFPVIVISVSLVAALMHPPGEKRRRARTGTK